MSQNLSRIRKYPILVPFALNIVSGVVKDGTLIVSWNSGVEATEQIDYGIEDDTVPNTTPETLLKPGDRGYVEGKDIPVYRTNHIVPFPETFVDSTHFFRVRSKSRRNETLESEVFRVYVTDKVIKRSYVAAVQVIVQPITVNEHKAGTVSGLDSSAKTGKKVSASGAVKAVSKDSDPAPVKEDQITKSAFETNITTTIT